MPKLIKLSESEWDKVYSQIKDEFKSQPAVFLIRDKMRETLGFTNRTHRYWSLYSGPQGGYDGHGRYIIEVHLDFYNESAETMFRLKYL
jgi:hypothetical protein